MRLGLVVALEHQGVEPVGQEVVHLVDADAAQGLALAVDDVHGVLGEAVPVRDARVRARRRAVEVHEAGIVVLRPVHGLCAEADDQA